MLFKKVLATTAFAGCVMAAMAQDTSLSVSFSGSVDGYYRFNPGGKDAPNSYTSFTNSANAFELGMASLRADATAMNGKVGATVDLGFGNRAKEFSYNDVGVNGLQYLKQAFVTYTPTKNLKFTAGKFGTHVGYEVLDPFANRNYSMSYMFTNGPFFHTGLKADITAGKVGFMVGVANHVDQSTASNGIRDFLAQVSLAPNDKWKIFLNYWGFGGVKLVDADLLTYSTNGSKSTSQFDLVVTGAISDKFSIGINGTVQSQKRYVTASTTKSDNWWGSALYLNFDPSPAVGLTLRGEYIGDKETIKFGTENIFQTTLSLDWKVGPLTIIPEVRLDNGKTEIFTKADGTGSKSTVSALVAAVYKF